MSSCVIVPQVKEFLKLDFDNIPNFWGQKCGTFLFYYGIFLDKFLLPYIKNNNLKDLADGRKFNFDENLINFITLLRNIANDRNSPLLLEGDFFYFQDCMTLFELCVIKENQIIDSENKYDFKK
jgi:hypothetical protein